MSIAIPKGHSHSSSNSGSSTVLESASMKLPSTLAAASHAYVKAIEDWSGPVRMERYLFIPVPRGPH